MKTISWKKLNKFVVKLEKWFDRHPGFGLVIAFSFVLAVGILSQTQDFEWRERTLIRLAVAWVVAAEAFILTLVYARGRTL